MYAQTDPLHAAFTDYSVYAQLFQVWRWSSAHIADSCSRNQISDPQGCGVRFDKVLEAIFYPDLLRRIVIIELMQLDKAIELSSALNHCSNSANSFHPLAKRLYLFLLPGDHSLLPNEANDLAAVVVSRCGVITRPRTEEEETRMQSFTPGNQYLKRLMQNDTVESFD